MWFKERIKNSIFFSLSNHAHLLDRVKLVLINVIFEIMTQIFPIEGPLKFNGSGIVVFPYSRRCIVRTYGFLGYSAFFWSIFDQKYIKMYLAQCKKKCFRQPDTDIDYSNTISNLCIMSIDLLTARIVRIRSNDWFLHVLRFSVPSLLLPKTNRTTP